MARQATAAACPHDDTKLELTTAGRYHAKRVCGRCGRFMGFIHRQETQQLRASRLAKINELWNGERTPDERRFLLSISDADGAMTPRQEGKLNGMWAYHIVSAELSR